MNTFIDIKSAFLVLLTFLGLSVSTTLGCIAAITAIIYNCMKIYYMRKEQKQKRKE